MPPKRQSETAAYVMDQRLLICLNDAYERSVTDLQHDFNDEQNLTGILHGISQGFAMEIHDAISTIFPTMNVMNASHIHMEDILKIRDIRSLEGSMFQKALVISAILDSIADRVADVIWKHSTGSDIDVVLRDALAIGEQESQRILDAYDALYQRTKRDFGL